MPFLCPCHRLHRRLQQVGAVLRDRTRWLSAVPVHRHRLQPSHPSADALAPAGSGAITLVLLTIFLSGFLLARLVGQSLTDLTRSPPQYQQQVSGQVDPPIEELAALNVELDRQQLLSYLDPSALMAMSVRLLGGLGGVLGNVFLILLTVVFMLLEALAPFLANNSIGVTDPKISVRTAFWKRSTVTVVIKMMFSLGHGAADRADAVGVGGQVFRAVLPPGVSAELHPQHRFDHRLPAGARSGDRVAGAYYHRCRYW